MKIRSLYFSCLPALLLYCGCLKGQESSVDSFIVKPQTSPASYLEALFRKYGLVNVQDLDTSILVDLRYADTSNFLKENLYNGLNHAFLNCEAAIRLANAQCFLKQENSNLSLIVLDAARPQHIQKLMWDCLNMPSEIKYNYLAPPSSMSMHNYGCAVDISIIDLRTHALLDMGSDFDFFGKISEPGFEPIFLKTGELSRQAYDNRQLLRCVMMRANFAPIHSEWWHFSSCTRQEAVAKYKLIK